MDQPGAGRSIRTRLIGANLLLLPLFLGFTFWMLDRAFASYQLDSLREQLRLQHLLLAKAADWDGEQWRVDAPDEPRLSLVDSGLYAFVLSTAGELLWNSPSAIQIDELDDPLLAVRRMVRKERLYQVDLGADIFTGCALVQDYFCYATGVAWGSSGPQATFLIMESQTGIAAARQAYRGYVLGLAVMLAVLLLLVQAWVIRWGLLPLGAIARDIGRLEAGELDELEESVPQELVPLTASVNQLLASEKRRRERVRNTMDRLAHVLKTPLMLLRNSHEEGPALRALVDEQTGRMLGIVEGELARARLDGRAASVLGQSVAVHPVLTRIVDAYRRLPRMDQQAEVAIDTSAIAADSVFLGEERDLQDLFGSILENSLKYCRSRIEVTARVEPGADRQWLLIAVADDGDGVPAGYEREVLRRGARADTASVGQGLGLSIVVEIASAYGGSVHVDNSPLGGAVFVVRLPGSSKP